MENNTKYLQPEHISTLANLELKAKLVVEGFIAGLHKSPYHGFSVEFAEHRQYMPGDEIRHIDWKVYGKTGRYYVKQYEEETNLKSYLLLDTSKSMFFQKDGIQKFEYASYLAASIAFLMIKQRDAVGLTLFDSKINKFLPPKSVKSYLRLLLTEISNVKSEESKTSLSSVFHEIAEKIKRRGLIVIFTDLFQNQEVESLEEKINQVISGLKHFRHKRHEVLVFHIFDPAEINFSFTKDAIFKDVETGDEISTQPWHIQKEYRQLIQDFTEKYKKMCRLNNIDYIPISTSEPFSTALTEYLKKRVTLGG
ncbi:MAG: DUF58 domain-containing protein [Calditrichaeota bacterium]|nr:MAG: DUF58 domain-containing protein [Calditrichota bacterium]